MEPRIQLKRVTSIPHGEKCLVLELTDIQLHTNARATQSAGKAIQRSVETNRPGRIFSPMIVEDQSEDAQTRSFSTQLPHDQATLAFVKGYNERGIRVFIQFPKRGLPVFAGKDTEEFVDSVKGQRILRRIRMSENRKS